MKTSLIFVCALVLASSTPAAEKPADGVSLNKFQLTGDLSGGRAVFTLEANAHVENPHGGALSVLRGAVGLTEMSTNPKWRLERGPDGFVIHFGRSGDFPIKLHFEVAVRQSNGWNEANFTVAPSTLQPVILRGLQADTQFDFSGAARPEYKNSEFISYLAGDGVVNLRWKKAQSESEGKLFYSGEMLSQITVSPGLIKQVALLDFKVMQGELNRVTLLLQGPGDVTRVQGDQVLAWNLETSTNSSERRLVVQLNQPQKGQFALQIQTQTPLGAFPQTADSLRLHPESATRFAGYLRVVNEGSVRLEVSQTGGLSQISPEQFPETELTRSALAVTGTQRFAYRFSGSDYALRIQADQILPEVTVSELLSYRLGENELSIDGEFELDIREAPLRELNLVVPSGYAIAQLNASGLSDYFLSNPGNDGLAELRLVFGQPIFGRQIVQLRLERNQPLGSATWTLPRVEVAKAKSVRGHIATAADAGFRLTSQRSAGLTEIATAFFPRKVPGIQAAFRLSEPTWQAALNVERLAQSLQADVLHLFSIGEGIAYGSSVMNYVISGAPVSVFKVELSDEYFNVEFTGKDVRNWQKIAGGYQVQLHTPVSGPYTLLASYERPFKRQGDTLTFAGARPLGVQSEQGHTLVISAYQFQVKPVDVSPGLLPLEPGEVPAEYRLLFDAPVLAAYHYVARPFNLRLALSPLAQGDSLSLVIDRATLNTRISKEGQVLTDARYFVKNRGNPHLRLTLPTGTRLWSVLVNGAPVVPVADTNSNLVPLPQGADPNSVLTLDFKLASVSSDPKRVRVAAPIVGAPVMLAEWRLGADVGQRLVYRAGSLIPAGPQRNNSGFAQVASALSGARSAPTLLTLSAVLLLVILGMFSLRWAGTASSRFNTRHGFGLLLGAAALIIAAVMVARLAEQFQQPAANAPRDLIFVAPVQQAGSPLNLEVLNTEETPTTIQRIGSVWPVLLIAPLWVCAWKARGRSVKNLLQASGWVTAAWVALRAPNGASTFLLVFAAFLLIHIIAPLLLHSWRTPPHKNGLTLPDANPGAATVGVALLAVAALSLGNQNARAALASRSEAKRPATADLVEQEIKIDDRFAFGVVKIHWNAEKGQSLPLLFEPAVLTLARYPTDSLRLEPMLSAAIGEHASSPTNHPLQQLFAKRSGNFDLELRYELPVRAGQGQGAIGLPVHSGLVNRVKLTVLDRDVDISSAQAVSVHTEMVGSNTVAEMVLSPATQVCLEWKPRSRDLKHEKPVFYAELAQLFIPTAGVIEAEQSISIRLAQGQISDLVFDVPSGMTVTDVLVRNQSEAHDDPAKPGSGSILSNWRFNPDARTLRVTLGSAQARPFTLLIRSQVTSGPLPFEKSLGLLRVANAAEQLGLVGVATGNEVQLESVTADSLTPVNLEDFPAELVARIQSQFGGLALRRAFRYARPEATLTLKAGAVEPDVRVESQDTISLGEDRSVLAVNASVSITRAGIFRLSFNLPPGFDVETISSPALSHWTESKVETNRVITLHLNGKTEGQQQFAISLIGPGAKATNGWVAPQLTLREANKQTGTVLLVPEQGLRLQLAASDGLAQLDPQKSGIKQKGVLAFRVLQSSRSLTLNLEHVNAWVQVTSLQHASVGEAQLKVAANLQYQIENAGLKSFLVLLPTNAESVRFEAEQLSDFLPVPGALTNGLQMWEVKLQRRVIGAVLLKVLYQTPLPPAALQVSLRGVQAAEVNFQRGFVTIESAGRLQLRVDSVPPALQPAEWQSIPRALQQGLPTSAANFSYRLVEADFALPLQLERYQAAQMLPARINSITFHSVISDEGVMLTQARLEMEPGSKRLLRLTLPQNARFWFAFVSQNGVWPWREQAQILIPLEQQSAGNQPVPVELFYTCKVGNSGRRSLNLELLAPRFDLPLENITWRVSLSDKWELKKWSGSLQLEQEQITAPLIGSDVQTYLQNETLQQQQRTKEAEVFLAQANSALAQGDPQQARRAFQSAFGLSTHDPAFNEDARVQLHNVKLQEALVALNVRQAASAGDGGALGGKLRELRDRKVANYTQQDAKDIIDRNSSDENAAFMKLAERLIQQQDAAATIPAALHASIPEQGRVLTFKRAVLVDPWASLSVSLKTTAAGTAEWLARSGILAVIFLALLGLGALAKFFPVRPQSS